MEADIVAKVLGVTGRTSKDGKYQMYDVALDDGNKYTTFDLDLANKAGALAGQHASARVEVVKKGNYDNYNLKDIAAQGQLPASAMPVQAGVPVAVQGAPINSIAPVVIPQQKQSKAFTEDDVVRITKLAAFGTAGALVGDLMQGAGPEAMKEAFELVVTTARVIYDAARAHEGQDATQLPSTPAEVAAAVPGVQVGVTETPPAEAPTVEWK